MTTTEPSAGDPIPPNAEVMEVQVADLQQLFNSIDPTPFHERDLDPDVEEFIVEWSREVPKTKPLALLVRIARPTGSEDEAAIVSNAIHQVFIRHATSTRRRLRRLLRQGRISLAIGLAVLSAAILVAQLVGGRTGATAAPEQVVRESLLIGGWVAMWRPIQVFLYDWWPILAEAKLFDRLAAMPVRLSYGTTARGKAPNA
jgi:hypothetical protein